AGHAAVLEQDRDVPGLRLQVAEEDLDAVAVIVLEPAVAEDDALDRLVRGVGFDVDPGRWGRAPRVLEAARFDHQAVDAVLADPLAVVVVEGDVLQMAIRGPGLPSRAGDHDPVAAGVADREALDAHAMAAADHQPGAPLGLVVLAEPSVPSHILEDAADDV